MCSPLLEIFQIFPQEDPKNHVSALLWGSLLPIVVVYIISLYKEFQVNYFHFTLRDIIKRLIILESAKHKWFLGREFYCPRALRQSEQFQSK